MFSWIFYIRFLYILQLKAIVLECPVTMMDSVTEVRHLPNVFVDLVSLTITVLKVCFYRLTYVSSYTQLKHSIKLS